jgi:AbrB family looped-hinge helix DNA binding protein
VASCKEDIADPVRYYNSREGGLGTNANSHHHQQGRVTLPKEVRDALRLAAGDRISFTLREDGIVEIRPEKDKGAEVAAITDLDASEVAETQMALMGELDGIPEWKDGHLA